MDDLLRRLETFVKPLYQDLDGISRFDEIERIRRIARTLYTPAAPREFELLLLLHGLGKWLDKIGNASRTALAVPGLTEVEIRSVAASARRLDDPQSAAERAVAAAILIDRAGVRGLALRFAAARREGSTLLDVVRDALAESIYPEWLPDNARDMLEQRFEARRRVCQALLDEM